MSKLPAHPSRAVVIGGLAATTLLGAGVLATAIGMSRPSHHAGGAVSRAAVALAASHTQRSIGPVDLDDARAGRVLQAALHDVNGHLVGNVRFTSVTGKAVLVQIHAVHLTSGFHGVHIHSVGVCDPAGAKPFSSAGPHLNPGHSAESMQAGALPVLLANPDGTADTEFVDAHFTLADLAGPTGASVVVHAGPDNFANVPDRYHVDGTAGPDAETRMTGDAGGRIACAVLVRATATAPAATSMPATSPTSTHTPTGTSMSGQGGMTDQVTPPKPTSPGVPTSSGVPTSPGVPASTWVPVPPTGAPSPTTLYGHHW
jgi:Cu-Zn family superoxide dismutase